MSTALKFGGVVAALLLLGAGGYIWWLNSPGLGDLLFSGVTSSTPDASTINATFSSGSAGSAQAPPSSPQSTAPRTAPEGTKEYQSARYRFSLFYPQELSYKEYDEGNGAQTVTFQNGDNSEAFQIFIVPYSKPQVDFERFKLDEPSGVLKDPQSVTIDSTAATIFFGQNSTMGETREVWFVHNGYLFEVTTYKDLDAWLSQIMASWKFI